MPNRRVKEVIGKRSVPTAGITTTIREAAKIMKQCRSSAIMVVDKGTLVGICTERDIVFGVVAEDLDPDKTGLAKIMTRKVQTIAPDKPFGHALHIMYEGGFRHVPVVDHAGYPGGLVTPQDALGIDALQLHQDLVRREEITTIL